MPQLTEYQRAAIETHDRNLIVVAGAGSGKTYVLVERYLALLDRHPEWQLNQLVAITFTQKAAQEMRDRVREALALKLEAAADDGERTLWSTRLAAMDSARIDTIHALCASLLRANAAEAGVDPGFEVLDEVESQLLLENAIDDALRGLVAEGSPALELFREYDAHAVREMLAQFVGLEISALPDNLFETWTTSWLTYAEACLGALYDDADFQSAAGWQPLDGFPNGDDLILNVWQNCLSCLEALHTEVDLSAHLEILARLDKSIDLRGGKSAVWGGKEGLDEAKAMLKRLRACTQETLKLIGEPPGDSDRRAADLLPHWLTLVSCVQETYRRAKLDRAALDFDDLERLTRDVLRDHVHVRERYCGKEFRHVLVDEFQDTNAVQWEIVQALVSPQLPGSLFVVGDPKQSIYAFRGADVSVFESVRGQIAADRGREIPLARSFRTHRVLVDCFNDLFARILVRDEHSPARAYQTTLDSPMEAQRQTAPCDDASLELILLDKTQLVDAEDKAEKARRWEARQIARRVRALVESGRPVYDKKLAAERPLTYGDVAMLFQSMSKITLYEDVFKEEGLPFVTVAGRGYYNRQEVWDMLNLLRALYNPADALALVAALRSPLFSLSDDALLALRFLANETYVSSDSLWLWKVLQLENPYLPADEAASASFAAACLNDLRRLAGRITISELLGIALERTGYLAVLTGLPDGARRRGNVEKLLEKAHASGKITLGAFSQYLKDLTDREIHEGEAALEGEGAVKLMTVHKSKGLEFSVVVLPDASWERGPRGGGALLAYDPAIGLACKVYDREKDKYVDTFASSRMVSLHKAREEAERKRLLYVAATRAQDALIVTGQVERKNERLRVSGWLEWLVAALDLQDVELAERQVVTRDWGIVDLSLPQPEALDVVNEIETSPRPEIEEPVPVDSGTYAAPPLLADVPVELDAPARALTATQIADLGGAIYGDGDSAFYSQRWRRSVLYDAPGRIERVSPADSGLSSRKVGEMVRQALRRWLPATSEPELRARLAAFAWEGGLVLPHARDEAVEQALVLVRQVLLSDVEIWSASARQVYRELPFVFQTGERLIHGVIDLLMQRDDGIWALVDYKTPFVSSAADAAALVAHARRYHLQVGVYAAAARELLGLEQIGVYIHYIRHEQTIAIPMPIWQSALDQLEAHIGLMVGVSDL
jgi:ATP-dependent helicase/nuclease subunit A